MASNEHAETTDRLDQIEECLARGLVVEKREIAALAAALRAVINDEEKTPSA